MAGKTMGFRQSQGIGATFRGKLNNSLLQQEGFLGTSTDFSLRSF